MEKGYNERYAEYDKYITFVDQHEHDGHYHSGIDKIDYSLAKENLSEDEFKIFIIYSSFKKCMDGNSTELIDIAEETLKQLKISSLDEPISSTYLNSLFSFDTIYKVLYDLLKLAVDGKYRGKEMSDDYINGVVDSIVVLKKFQRYNGFGDFEWTMNWNDAISYTPKGI